MGFLDNSGDIILDAVLTDTGRARLARADGSFQITKFAFGDDEVNYGSYNKNHPSGSAYYDLDILQTPVFEAFTNNSSILKFKLQSITRTNLLYLPILRLNNDQVAGGTPSYTQDSTQGSFVVACDTTTESSLGGYLGVLKGVTGPTSRTDFITVDQGLDTQEISRTYTIDSDLKETQYLIEIDNRFGSVVNTAGTLATLSFIDDDNVASYFLSTADTSFVTTIPLPSSGTTTANSIIAGPTGTRLQFSIKSSLDLTSSTFLFTQLGITSGAGVLAGAGSDSYYVISTNVKITGVTTGYSINIPVRFVKKV
jgi:hypothetical protein